MKEYLYILSYNGSSTTLGYNPAGYDKLGITFMRHEVYHSVLRTFTLSLRFLNITHPTIGTGGYDIIQSAYNADGIFADVSIEIKKRNPDTNDYDTLYTGVLDFTPGRWSMDRDLFFEIAINDSSKLQKFISRDENDINIFDTQSIDSVTFTPITLRTANLPPVDIVLGVDVDAEIITAINYTNATSADFYMSNPTYRKHQTDNFSIDGIATIYTNSEDNNKRLDFLLTFNYDLYVNIETLAENTFYLGFRIMLYDENGDSVYGTSEILYSRTLDFSNEFTVSGLKVHSQSFNETTSPSSIVKPNYTVEFEIWVSTLATANGVIHVNNTHVVYMIEKTYGEAATDSNCILPYETSYRAIQLLTSEEDEAKVLYSTVMGRQSTDFESYAANGSLAYFPVQSGLMLRNYPTPILNIKFRDLFKSFDAIWNLGLGFDNVNDRFYIELLSSFYDASLKLFDAPSVSKFKRHSFPLAYASKIEAGYSNDGRYERVGGAIEVNTKRQYSSGAKVKETINIECPYRFDSVGFEDVRSKQYLRDGASDNDGDNDVFIFKANLTGGKYLPEFPSSEDFPTSAQGYNEFYSYYNLMLTPRQNTIRHGNHLKATHYKLPFDIKAQRTEKQYSLEIYGHDENSSIALSELADSLFIPELYTFESYLTIENVSKLLENPHGYIDFTYNNVAYSGFINKIELTDYNTKANFELIARDTSIDIRTFEDASLHKFEDGTQKYGE